jgi:nuclear transport factor 2 (NTF2) superfamily protein
MQPKSAEPALRAMYDAFNARDSDGVLAALADDVDWPNAWEGGRLHGHEAVRDYWTRQWAAIDPHVEPVGFETLTDGRVAVAVDQTVDGSAAGRVRHVYTFRDGLVTLMEVEET